MKTFSKIAALTILFALALFLSLNMACRKKAETYKIGAILPLTGNLAVFGENEQNAMTLAQEEIDKKGKIKLEIIYEDSKGEAKEGVTAANKLIDFDNCKFLFTSLSGISLATQPIADKSKTIQFTICMDPDITDKSEYTFRIYPNMWQEAELVTSYIKKINAKRIAIFYVAISSMEMEINDYLMPKLTGTDCKIVMRETFQFGDVDVKPQILKIKRSNPDLLLLLVYPNQYPLVFDALSKVGLIGKLPIVCTISMSFKISVPDSLLEGTVFVSPSFTLKERSDFAVKYKEKYGKEPTFDAAFTYDALMLLTTVLEKVGYEPEKTKTEMLNIKEYNGVSGPISILPNGDAKVAMELGIVKNGKRIPYEVK